MSDASTETHAPTPMGPADYHAGSGDVVAGEVIESSNESLAEAPAENAPTEAEQAQLDFHNALASVGAAAMAELLGYDFDAMDTEQQTHYMQIAAHTFNAMLDKGVELGRFSLGR